MENIIGIDAGGTFIKMVYYESGRFHYKKYKISEMDRLVNWLNVFSNEKRIFLTGGKAKLLSERLALNTNHVDEFEAMAVGSKSLLADMGILNEEYILISIGTGTSIYYISPHSFERITGTGIGGGTFIGLGTLLAKNNDFNFLIDYASRGDRSSVDLLVKDIYENETAPIMGELTAANFGKVFELDDFKLEDQLAALLQMIAETIMLLTIHAANSKKVGKLVFAGGMLEGNHLFKQLLEYFSKMMDLEPLFLEKGNYVGAIGALKSKFM